MKWTIDNLEDESDSEELKLPQPKEISRSSLAAEDFDTQQFLADHAAFRSLQELQKAILEWENRLHTELLDTVNNDFDEFVNSVDSIRKGEPSLERVRREIEKFEINAKEHEKDFEELEKALDSELRTHKQLSQKECQAQRLLYLYDLLADLENAVPEAQIEDPATLISLAKMYVAMALIAHDSKDVRAVNVLQASMQVVFTDLLKKLDDSLSIETQKKSLNHSSVLGLLEAREHVLSTKQ